MKKIFLTIAIVTMLLVPATVAQALPNQEVTVTATPAFIAIANTPGTWTINGEVAGSSVLDPDTLYYANPLGDETPPSNPVVNGDCRFAVTNTSTVNVNITVNFPDPSAGESTNSGTALNGASTFAAHSYTSYAGVNAWPADKQIAKITGSTVLLNAIGGAEFWWGLEYESQSGAWTSPDAMVSTVTITATAS